MSDKVALSLPGVRLLRDHVRAAKTRLDEANRYVMDRSMRDLIAAARLDLSMALEQIEGEAPKK